LGTTQGIGHAAEAYFKSGMTMSGKELEEIRQQREAVARENEADNCIAKSVQS